MDPARQELLSKVGELIDQHKDFRISLPDDSAWFSLEDEVVSRVLSLLRLAAALAEQVRAAYQEEGGRAEAVEVRSEGETLREIGAQISTELAAQEISGLALVARGQILELEESVIASVEAGDLWQAASHSDTAVRRALKALVALETAISEYEGAPDRRRLWEKVEDSIEVRRLYSQFRRAVLRGGEPPEEALRERLRSVDRRIAILRDLQVYALLRFDDRIEIRRLQKRIRRWLAGEGNPRDGRRLWQDVVAFARLLAHVNLREELLEHDREVVSRLVRKLFVERGQAKLDHHVRACLASLEGRDDELDRFILRPYDCEVPDLRQPLERLQRELTKPYEMQMDLLNAS